MGRKRNKAHLVAEALFILPVLVLYRLLKGVEKPVALLMLVFAAVQVPISYSAEIQQPLRHKITPVDPR